MDWINEFLTETWELNIFSTLLRLAIAVFCGGLVGIDRGRRRRPAGFRTHMLVCLGAALAMMTGQYVIELMASQNIRVSSDVSRLGAQVISGIGFIGAGTIIVTGRQETKGLTTAAGLWASACMGLAIGAGFYLGAVLCCLLILFTITIMRRVESLIMSKSRNMNLYVELVEIDDIGLVIDMIKSQGIRIYDLEINKASPDIGAYAFVVFAMCLPAKQPHSDIMAKLAGIKSIRSLEEI